MPNIKPNCTLRLITLAGLLLLPLALTSAVEGQVIYSENFNAANAGTYTTDQATIPGLSGWAFDEVTSFGRLRTDRGGSFYHSASRAISLDPQFGGSSQINHVIWTTDMSAYDASCQDIFLDFWWMDHNDIIGSNDRVWIRGNNTAAWIEVFNWQAVGNPPGVYDIADVDISTPLQANGQVFSSTFQVRFGQDGGNAIVTTTANGGMTFDDVSLNLVSDHCAAIGDLVWEDTDTDGVKDAGEGGVQGVTVELQDGSCTPGSTCPTEVTDSNGAYLFAALADGNYTVDVIEATLPSGAILTTANEPQAVTISGNQRLDIDFGYQLFGSITGTLFRDMDDDGNFDLEDPVLGGVQVEAQDGSCTPGSTCPVVVTDAGGTYTFSGLVPGNHTIDVLESSMPATSTATTGNEPQVVAAVGGQTVAAAMIGYDYGSEAQATLPIGEDFEGTSGEVYNDHVSSMAGVEPHFSFKALTGTARSRMGVAGWANNGVAAMTLDGATVGGASNNHAYLIFTANLSGYDVDVDQIMLDFSYFHHGARANAPDRVYVRGSGALPRLTLYDWTNGGSTGNPITNPSAGTYDDVTVDVSDFLKTHSQQFGEDFQLIFSWQSYSLMGESAVTKTYWTGFTVDDICLRPSAAPDCSGAVIGDRVWDDRNGDGIQDAGEPGFNGLTIELQDATCTPGSDCATTTTSGDGNYTFAALPPGTYTIVVTTPPASSSQTYDADGTGTADRSTVTVATGEVKTDQDFGYRYTGSIAGTAWNDRNGNSSLDGGEAGIAGLAVELQFSGCTSGVDCPTTVTSGTGAYSFSFLAPRTYTVVITPPAGANQTYDADGTGTPHQSIYALGTNETRAGENFGYQYTASLGDFLFADLNNNGSFDSGEPGISAIQVELQDGVCTPGSDCEIAVTDANGNYGFSNLAGGNYTVDVVNASLPGGSMFTTTDPLPVVLAPGAADDTADFGIRVGVIGDLVFGDTNGNGVMDGGETGLAGITIELQSSGCTPGSDCPTTVTDANGAYLFVGLPSTNYTVDIDESSLPAGYVSTTGNEPLAIALGAAQNYSAADFGYAQSASTSGLVFRDGDLDGVFDSTDPVMAGIVIELQSVSCTPGSDCPTTATANDGTWSFTDLPPGSYTLDLVNSSLPLGATITSGNDPLAMPLTAGQQSQNNDFGVDVPSTGQLTLPMVETFEGTSLEIYNGDSAVIDGVDPGFTFRSSQGDGRVRMGLTPGFANNGVAAVTLDASTATESRSYFMWIGDLSAYSAASDQVLLDFSWMHHGEISDSLDRVWIRGDGGFFIGYDLTQGTPATQALANPGTYADVTINLSNLLVSNSQDFDEDFMVLFSQYGDDSTVDTMTVRGMTFDDICVRTDAISACPTGATIGNRVWDDRDADGVQDSGEPGLENVAIELQDATCTPSTDCLTTLTDVDGNYTFLNLDPGTYTVVVTPPTGTTQTFDADGTGTAHQSTVTVGLNATDLDQDFGYRYAGSIAGTVWDDRNGNASFDGGENGIGSLAVELRFTGCTPSSDCPTTTTSGAGAYSFANLAPRSYTIVVTPPAGSNQTFDVDGLGSPHQSTYGLGTNEARTGENFGYRYTGSIGDLVWNDLNGNGSVDAGETGLSGVQIELQRVGCTPGSDCEIAVTDGSGAYSFVNLSAGSYTVDLISATIPTGAVVTTGNDPAAVSLSAGQALTTVDFGVQTASIGDLVFEDLDGDGVKDAGEPGISSVVLELQHVGCTPSSDCPTTSTNVSGAYLFTGLDAGNYTVDVDESSLPANSLLTTANEPAAVSLSGGQQLLTVDFGYATGASVAGIVFDDPNGNQTLDATDRVVAGVVLELQDATCTPGSDCATVTSGNDGTWSFTNLTPGSYTVDVDGATLPVGSVLTTANDPLAVSLTSGENSTGNDFGYDVGPSTVTVPVLEKWEGTTGETYDGDAAAITGASGFFTFRNAEGDARARLGLSNFGRALNDAITLDASSGTTSQGYLMFVGDMSGYDAGNDTILLDFSWMHHGELADTLDRVWVRGDEDSAWIEIYDWTGGAGAGSPLASPGAYTDVSDIDISAALVGGGQNFGEGFSIRFGQRGDGSTATLTTNRGFTLDDFCLRPNSVPRCSTAATVGDRVWDDRDGDGTQDAGEPGLGGLTVELQDGVCVTGSTCPTETTAADGSFLFLDVTAGTYAVVVTTPPAGGTQTFDADGIGTAHASSLTVSGFQVRLDQDFGYQFTGSIGDRVWNDRNGNGALEGGEAGISGVALELRYTGCTSGVDCPTTSTNGTGDYSFGNLSPRSYTVVVTAPPAGSSQTYDADGLGSAHQSTLSLGVSQTNTAQDFGYQYSGSIGDLVWNDLNGNGSVDGGENGLSGVQLELQVVGCTPGSDCETTLTDGSGAYAFVNLPAGSYTVDLINATVPAGATVTTGNDPAAVSLSAGQTLGTVDFGVQAAAIGNRVFDDQNGNGVDDAEPGLASVTVELQDGSCVPTSTCPTTTTDGTGAYLFTGLAAGSYTIDVDETTLPANVVLTAGSDPAAVSVAGGQQLLTVDFGYTASASMSGLLFDDPDADQTLDTTERVLGGVVLELDDGSCTPGSDCATTTSNNDGTWSFTDLAPGSYTVDVDESSLPAGSVLTTANEPLAINLSSGQSSTGNDFGYDVGPTAISLPVGERWEGTSQEVYDGNAAQITGASGFFAFRNAEGSGRARLGLPNFGRAANAAFTIDASSATTSRGYLLFIGDMTGLDPSSDTVLLDFSWMHHGELADTIDRVYVRGNEDASWTVIYDWTQGTGTGSPLPNPGVYTDVSGLDVSATLVGAGQTYGEGFGVLFAQRDNDSTVDLFTDRGLTIDNFCLRPSGLPQCSTGATIGDRVWDDRDGDGAQDVGEPGLGGLTLELQDGVCVTGSTCATDTTAADGSFLFLDVVAGTYDVVVTTPPAGGSQTYDADGTGTAHVSTLTVSGFQVDLDQDFGYQFSGSIGDRVWNDRNNNGAIDGGETGISGVALELRYTGCTASVSCPTTTTDASGNYSFANLSPRDYTVVVTAPPAGSNPSYDADGTGTANQSSLTLGVSEANTAQDFGYQYTGSIGDFVWSDLDGDGVQDGGEPGIAGVVIELQDGSCSPGSTCETAVSNGSGAYGFAALAAGSYTVDVVSGVPAGAGLTGGSDPTVVNLAAGEARADVDFGYQTASISGHIFDDANSNGVLDGGETGVSGVTVEAVGGGCTQGSDCPSAVTDGSGNYTIGGLSGIAYSVDVDESTLPPNSVLTTANEPHNVSLSNGQQYTAPDFGYTLPGPTDWGDLPDTGAGTGAGNYETLGSDNGAAHQIGGPRLGWCVDADSNGQPSAGADGDDLGSGPVTSTCLTGVGDEDGVEWETAIIEEKPTLVRVQGDIGATCRLDAWIDWNGNGSFLDAGEQIAQNRAVASGGRSWVSFIPPAGSAGTRYARFRCSSVGNLGPTGFALDGEVEDYAFTVESPAHTLGSRVWDDQDGDGIQDGSEPGLSGVTVNLYGPGSGACSGGSSSTVTNGSGDYTFTGLAVGDYCLEFVAPGGREFTRQIQGTAYGSDAPAGASNGQVPNIELRMDRDDFDAGLVLAPSSCSATTDVGGVVYREMLFDGIANGAASTTYGDSPLLSTFSNPGYGGHTSPAVDPFVGGFPYSGVGKETVPLRMGEAGLAGVAVTVFGDGNTVLGSTTTDAFGRWSVTPSGAPATGTPVLVEFSGWPSRMAPGPLGANNGGAVTVADVGDCDVDFTAGNPADNCSNNPELTLSCFVPTGSSITDTIVDMAYQDPTPYVRSRLEVPIGTPVHDEGAYQVWEEYFSAQPSKSLRGDWSGTGNVGGLAWDAKRGVVYGAPHYKFDAPIGGNGLGAITRDNSLWLDLAAAPVGLTVDFGTVCNYGSGPVRCKNDVGYMGLGDIDIADDYSEVYTINLATQEIVAIPILPNGSADANNVRLYAAPAPPQCNANAGSFDRSRAPYGLGYHEDRLYVGVTCTNAGSNSVGPHGFVYSFDPTQPSPTYTLEGSADLAHTKYHDDWLFVQGSGGSSDYLFIFGTNGYTPVTIDDWGAQSRTYPDIPSCTHSSGTTCSLNQPWLVDIEFDVRPDGTDDMVMGIRNRTGDIWKSAGGHNGGDIVRLCETAAGSDNWVSETLGSGACDDLSPSQRHTPPYANNALWFYDTQGAEGRFATGSLAQIPGFVELVAMGVDNIATQDHSGVAFLDNNKGDHSRDATILGAVTGMRPFNKAISFGDVEAMCPPADFIIGDSLWLDTVIENGLRDPSESPVVGATVEIYVDSNSNGVLDGAEGAAALASVVTDGDGHYAFSRSAHGLQFDSDYIVVIPASNFSGGPLVGYEATTANAGASDTRDSDGVVGGVSGLIEAPVTTQGPGRSIHDLDFGFKPLPVVYDVALRVTTVATTVPAGGSNAYTLEVHNQGTLDATNIQVRQYVDTTHFEVFSLASNPAGTTGGGAGLSYSWVQLGSHGVVTIAGSIPGGVSVNLPVNLTLKASASGDVPTWSEVLVDNGSDIDSQPESEETDDNADTLVDNAIDNVGGDEDDHDIVWIAVQNGRIGDYVWFDANRDGIQNGSESGISGVMLRLYRDNGDNIFDSGTDTMIGTDITDGDGGYMFIGLSEDDYFVDPDETTLPAGFVATVGTPAVSPRIALPDGGSRLDIDCGYAPAGGSAIGDFIWYDANGDATADPGEIGLPGVEVTVTGPGGYNQTTNTGPDGYYLVTGVVQSGDYTVSVNTATLPAGLDPQPTGYPSATHVFPVIAGEDMLFADFGFLELVPTVATIGDTVFMDVDGDGTQGAGEPGISGVTIDLIDASSNHVATMTTNGIGQYDFVGLLAGDYQVEVTDVHGMLFGLTLSAGTSPTAPISLIAGQDYNDADFGYEPDAAFGTIGNLVWHDANSDGAYDPDEDGIERVKLELWQDVNNNGNVDVGTDVYLRSTKTNGGGNYLFTRIPLGTYLVRIVDEESVLNYLTKTIGVQGVDNNSQPEPYATTIVGGRASTDLRADFGFNTPPPEFVVSGTVFFDNDADATWDPPAESGIGGATLTLYRDQNSDGILDITDPLFGVTTSQANGYYEFIDLPGFSDWIVTVDVTGTFLAGGTQTTQTSTGGIEPAAVVLADSPDHDFGFTKPPTAALVTEFGAFDAGGHVQLEWTTTSESGTMGFWAYRAVGDGWQSVQDVMLPALFGEPQGGHYRMADRTAVPGETNTYWLLEIESGGGERWHGPYTVDARTVATDVVASADATPAAVTAVDRERRRRAGEHRQSGSRAPFGNADRARVRVMQTGVQEVSVSDLAAQFSVPLSSISQRLAAGQLRLTQGGRQVSWWAGDSGLRFYAPKASSHWAAYMPYFIELQDGRRAQTFLAQAPESGNPSVVVERAEFEQNLFAATAAARDASAELWFWSALVGNHPLMGSKSFAFDLAELASTQVAELAVELSGATASTRQVDHEVTFRINGVDVGTYAWDGSGARSFGLTFDGSILQSSNVLEIEAHLPEGVAESVIYLDSFAVTYNRRSVATTGELVVKSTGGTPIHIDGVGDDEAFVLDVTNPQDPVLMLGLNIDTGADSVSFYGRPGSTEYIVSTPTAIRSPAVESSYDLQAEDADYLVITPASLQDGAQALASYRASFGYRTAVVGLEDIFDRYAAGNADPVAIRSYLNEAYTRWQVKPRFAVLLGKGTVDTHNYKGLGDSLVPVLLAETPQGVFASDSTLGDVSGNDGIPEIAVGRIPVVNAAELDDYLAKLMDWEEQDLSDRVILAADQPDDAGLFSADSNALGQHLPSGSTVAKIYLDQLPIGTARSQLSQSLASGAWLLNWQGHGGLGQLSSQGLLRTSDVASLPSSSSLPILASMTCSVGRFELPGLSALGEVLVLEPGRGAIATWAPSGLSVHDSARILNQALVDAMLDEPTLGEAVLRALEEGEIGLDYMRKIYNLLGDPATQLHLGGVSSNALFSDGFESAGTSNWTSEQ